MKKKLKKILTWLIIVVMFVAILPDIKGYAITQSEFDQKLNELRAQYPDYSVWNDWFDNGHQCYGFARLIGYNVFGSMPSSWNIVYSIDNVKAGDLIQYGNTSGSGHTVFVTKVSGDTITYVDCNGNGNYSGATKVRSNGVKWDNTIKKGSKIWNKYSFSYIVSSPGIESHNCDNHSGSQRWQVSVSSVLNIRSGPGTGYQVVGNLSNGTEIYIDQKAKSDGYTWGKLTTGQGWVALDGNANYLCGGLNSNPLAHADSVSAGAGTVNIRGWAFDNDDINANIIIHVYIGGEFAGDCVADQERQDIEDGYHVGKNHGFEKTISTNKTGRQRVQIYALNIDDGNNTVFWDDDIDIKSTDTEGPSITDIQVIDIDSEGYTVTCTVTDNKGVAEVRFPTWTVYNDQDDLGDWWSDSKYLGSINGSKVTYRVNISDHNNETGEYITHIYATDINGNRNAVAVGTVVIETLNVTTALSEDSISAGQTVTITANARGGSRSYVYSYLVYNRDLDSWIYLKSDSAANTYNWTVNDVATYLVYVIVKDSAGKQVQSDGMFIGVGYPELKITGKSNASTVNVGEKVTLTGTANGGNGSYTYNYLVHNKDTNQWSRLTSSFTSSNTYTWTAGSAGNREFFVEVKDSTGKVVRSSAINVNVKKSEDKLSVSIGANKNQGNVGNNFTFFASANGGNGSYTYSYLVHNKDTNQWSRLTSSFTTSNTCTWTARSAGNREFFVEVKDTTGKVVRSSAMNVTVTEAEKPLAVSAKSSASSITKGSKVTITGTASGGKGGYTYSYLVHNKDTNAWSRLTPSFTISNTYTWTAGSTGNREFFVEVKDSTGKVVRSSAVNIVTTEAEKPLAITAKSSASTITKGSKVTITGTASGGKGGYTYSYLVHNKDTNAWSRLTSSFTTSNTYTWTAGSAGTREFFVEVKDSTGKVVRSRAVNVSVKATASNMTVIAGASASQTKVGNNITILGSTSGGIGNYTYSYLVHNKDTNQWSRLTSFIESNTYVWTAGSTGNREFFVEVKDSTGKVVRSSAVNVVTK